MPAAPWKLPWPVRSVLAGAAGTSTMTVAYAIVRRLRPGVDGPLDYDDGPVPGQIVARILRLGPLTSRQHTTLAFRARWIYGSLFGLWHGLLTRRVAEPWASTAFAATLMSATVSVFPLLGRTPPPWRWSPSTLATSVGTHAAYVGAVAAISKDNR